MAESVRESKSLLNGQFKVYLDEPNSAICNLCDAKFKYHHSTSSLSYHLKSKHPFSSTANSSSTSSSCAGRSPELGEGKRSNNEAKDQTLLSFLSRKTTPTHELNIAKALALWIAKSMRPPNIVQDAGLIDVLRVATGNPEYVPPGRKAIMTKLHDLYEMKSVELQRKLKNAALQRSSICVALDYWTSTTANDSYLGVIIFFVDDSYEYQHFTIGVDYASESHSAENVKNQVLQLLAQWEIDINLVTCFCTDNAPNMLKAVKLIGKLHSPCMAHTLQLSIKYALEQTNSGSLLAKCRKIVGHFKHSAIQESRLEEEIKAALPDGSKERMKGLVSSFKKN